MFSACWFQCKADCSYIRTYRIDEIFGVEGHEPEGFSKVAEQPSQEFVHIDKHLDNTEERFQIINNELFFNIFQKNISNRTGESDIFDSDDDIQMECIISSTKTRLNRYQLCDCNLLSTAPPKNYVIQPLRTSQLDTSQSIPYFFL